MPLRQPSRHLIGLFVTGALAACPLAATFAIFWWVAGMLIELAGRQPGRPGNGYAGPGRRRVGAVRLPGRDRPGVRLARAAGRARPDRRPAGCQPPARRRAAPHSAVARSTISQRGWSICCARATARVREVDAAVVPLGGVGEEGVAVLRLLVQRRAGDPSGAAASRGDRPTRRFPVGGGLLFVPSDWVRVADVGMEALTSIYYVSMGVTAQQRLRKAQAKCFRRRVVIIACAIPG